MLQSLVCGNMCILLSNISPFGSWFWQLEFGRVSDQAKCDKASRRVQLLSEFKSSHQTWPPWLFKSRIAVKLKSINRTACRSSSNRGTQFDCRMRILCVKLMFLIASKFNLFQNSKRTGDTQGEVTMKAIMWWQCDTKLCPQAKALTSKWRNTNNKTRTQTNDMIILSFNEGCHRIQLSFGWQIHLPNYIQANLWRGEKNNLLVTTRKSALIRHDLNVRRNLEFWESRRVLSAQLADLLR